MQNKQQGIISPIVIAIIVIAVLGVGGYVAYTQYSEKITPEAVENEVENTENTETNTENTTNDQKETNTTETTTQQTELAGWKTYTNTEYGFEIKYPTEYKTQEIPTGGPTGINISLARGSVVAHEIDSSIINISLPEDCMFTSKDLEDKNYLLFVSTKNINGVDFNYYINHKSLQEYLGGYCGMSAGCWYADVYRTLHNGKCYEIKYERSDRVFTSPDNYRAATAEELAVPDAFDQMLATFKFTK
ncbi:MAG: hypothetical protein Q8Q48_01815 [Candidatus Staskawiczbacteria bacterium]|nr:hypothetical protein [Candidatus Staskawiczbacteria bacterium]